MASCACFCVLVLDLVGERDRPPGGELVEALVSLLAPALGDEEIDDSSRDERHAREREREIEPDAQRVLLRGLGSLFNVGAMA